MPLIAKVQSTGVKRVLRRATLLQSLISKEAWQNLRVEIVANARGGKGAWPAIWLRSPNTRGFAEVDLMEHLGREPQVVHSTVHFGTSSSSRDVKTADRTIPGFQGKDVLYSAELTPRKLVVRDRQQADADNGQAAQRRQSSTAAATLQSDHQSRSGRRLGQAPIDDAALPATMTIKVIRVWEWRPQPGSSEISLSE